jgi:2-polyprenyl-3-methyl-5-hydroxy-6-metoxy-1,4-benzoquinol methylase
MTVWEDIYQEYRKGGKSWATLSEDVNRDFASFIKRQVFPIKNALDIGCGDGKYLKFLHQNGFTISGIDSSPTAIEMTRLNLKEAATLTCTNMFSYKIPPTMFDLVFSISTIHHGNKSAVGKLLTKIYESLVSKGSVFITLPDLATAKKHNLALTHRNISQGTYAPIDGPERGLAHSFYDKNEVKSLFDKYSQVDISLDEIGRWIICAQK